MRLDLIMGPNKGLLEDKGMGGINVLVVVFLAIHNGKTKLFVELDGCGVAHLHMPGRGGDGDDGESCVDGGK